MHLKYNLYLFLFRFDRVDFCTKNNSVSRKSVISKLSSLGSVFFRRNEWVVDYLKDDCNIGSFHYYFFLQSLCGDKITFNVFDVSLVVSVSLVLQGIAS